MTVAHRTEALAAPSLTAAVVALRTRGMRVSATRRALLETLFRADRPRTAEELAGGLDLASVYRNLDALEAVGLVRHVHVGHGPGLLRARRAAATRGYAACERCGRHARARRPTRSRPCAPPCAPRPASPADFSHFPIVGRCPDCARPPERSTMHIPDGFLSPEVAAGTAVVAAGAVGVGLRRAGARLDDRVVPLLGVTGAFVFAAQMLNFPVAGGTSGHFLGAALATILLGPWLACLVLAVVLATQSFVFADGGVSALGANVLNMGVLGALATGGADARRPARAAAPPRRPARRRRRRRVARGRSPARPAPRPASRSPGTVPLGTVLPAMLGVHVVIGLGEAVITVAALSALMATRPDLIGAWAPPEPPRARVRPLPQGA